jgi:MSHA biogenesis protein MshJ
MKGLKLPAFAMPKWSLPSFKRAEAGLAVDPMPPKPESMLSRAFKRMPGIDTVAPQLLPRWRQLRREFDARLPNERRLIIVAVIAMIGYLCDLLLITPGFNALKAANQREQVATTARDAIQTEINRKRVELASRLMADQKEQEALRKRLSEGEQELERQQAMMAPAREMQNLLEGLLAQHGQLRLKAMRTQPPIEVQLNAEQRAFAAGKAGPVLYSHGMEISVSGPFLDLVGWLRSVEQLPRRLLWSGMSLKVVDGAAPTLTLQVQTYSPDRDPLEIAP